MGTLGWIGAHWFEFLQTASILVGFFTAAYTIRTDTKERKIGNLFALTNAHREIWSRLYERKELSRVLVESVNLRREPITAEEELFVHTLILHLRAAFKARAGGHPAVLQSPDSARGLGAVESLPRPRFCGVHRALLRDMRDDEKGCVRALRTISVLRHDSKWRPC